MKRKLTQDTGDGEMEMIPIDVEADPVPVEVRFSEEYYSFIRSRLWNLKCIAYILCYKLQ